MLQFLDDAHCDLSIDMAISIASAFLKQIAQPLHVDTTTGVALISEEQLLQLTQANANKLDSIEHYNHSLRFPVSQG